MYVAAADLTQLAGFMSFDLRLHGAAQQYFLLGLRLAKEAGDRLQAARMLYCLARQMIELGQPRAALELVHSGLYVIRRAGNARVAAMLHAMEGRAFGGMGEASECRRAIGRAEEEYVTRDGGEDPGWIAFFSQAELAGISGVALRDLALHHLDRKDAQRSRAYAVEARPYITQAAEGRSKDYLRSQVLDLDGLAVVSFLAGEPDMAVATLNRALDVAAPVSSARAERNLRRTVRLGRSSYGELPDVRELSERARATLSPDSEGA
jgi:hypothetical protein